MTDERNERVAPVRSMTAIGIVMTFPIAVIDRPGSTLSFLTSVVAKTFDYARVDEAAARRLARMEAPAWTFIHGPRSMLSSTAIRGEQK